MCQEYYLKENKGRVLRRLHDKEQVPGIVLGPWKFLKGKV